MRAISIREQNTVPGSIESPHEEPITILQHGLVDHERAIRRNRRAVLIRTLASPESGAAATVTADAP